jgi:quercetin dioxygenase-like cupin family protein
MIEVINVADRKWVREDLVGVPVDRATLWNDGQVVSFSLVNMPADYNLGLHRHETWVGVMVISGSLRLECDGAVHEVQAGGFYFVSPNSEHLEKSVDAATVLIVKAEPNIQYPINSDGSRR